MTLRSRTHGNTQKHESRNPAQRWLITRFHREVVRLVALTHCRTALDVGCGEGRVIEALRQSGSEVDFTGIDQSSEAIDDARRRLGPSVDLRMGDAADLTRAKETYDLVMMLEVLEHIDRPGRILPVLQRLTDRHVLFSVPDEPWFRLMNLLRLKNVKALGNDPEHVNQWSFRRFPRFIAEEFDIIEAKRAFPWTLVLAEKKR